jgi:hypothetical protein
VEDEVIQGGLSPSQAPKKPRESDDLWILDLDSQMLKDVDGCWYSDVIIYKLHKYKL